MGAALAVPATVIATASGAGTALAQAEVAPGTVEGPGVKVGEGTVVHPTLGFETGVISNVFFEDTNENFSGIARVIAEFAASSLSRKRLASGSEGEAAASVADAEGATTTENPGDLQWDLNLRLAYEEWLSPNARVRAQRDLAVGADAAVIVNPRATWQFGAEDGFTREIRPTNYESRGNLDRDINKLVLKLKYQPEGRTISGHLAFTNLIDVFEGDNHDFANRIQNTLGARADWRLFPYTNIYGEASIGYFTGLGSASEKATSFPLRVTSGIQSAITVNTTAALHVGFAKGFYSAGPDFTMAVFGGRFGYRYSPEARSTILYDYNFADSINANFYRDHAIRLQHEQVVRDYLASAKAGLVFRSYRGIDPGLMGSSPDRSDVIFDATLAVSRSFRDWLAGSVEYHFETDQTGYMQAGDDPSYTRHQLLVGIRAAL